MPQGKIKADTCFSIAESFRMGHITLHLYHPRNGTTVCSVSQDIFLSHIKTLYTLKRQYSGIDIALV